VSSAARGLIALFRELAPGMLEKKDRGRGADLARSRMQYGAAQASRPLPWPSFSAPWVELCALVCLRGRGAECRALRDWSWWLAALLGGGKAAQDSICAW
jgi:hypothetical protein